jgi:hypothetical protein
MSSSASFALWVPFEGLSADAVLGQKFKDSSTTASEKS